MRWMLRRRTADAVVSAWRAPWAARGRLRGPQALGKNDG